MKRIVCAMLLLLCQAMALGQETIDLLPIIRDAYPQEAEMGDYLGGCREGFALLRKVPCNMECDTIYAVEAFSYLNRDCWMGFWSKMFVYGGEGELNEVFRFYHDQRFERWLVRLVERWDEEAILEHQSDYAPYDYHYVFMRIVIDHGTARAEAFACTNEVVPTAEEVDLKEHEAYQELWESEEHGFFDIYDCKVRE